MADRVIIALFLTDQPLGLKMTNNTNPLKTDNQALLEPLSREAEQANPNPQNISRLIFLDLTSKAAQKHISAKVMLIPPNEWILKNPITRGIPSIYFWYMAIRKQAKAPARMP